MRVCKEKGVVCEEGGAACEEGGGVYRVGVCEEVMYV